MVVGDVYSNVAVIVGVIVIVGVAVVVVGAADSVGCVFGVIDVGFVWILLVLLLVFRLEGFCCLYFCCYIITKK